ncbi:D-alanyl-D-alanine carboxypeptidase family protein [uncultured Jatrophihabitans sp.]|uniref:D-alanyl-D-alanine carboxypeptidase family protein n=1 Tax=uncultured Jatrophihabitans sp. TaxID=1610747 RepID=UPI0035CC4713
MRVSGVVAALLIGATALAPAAAAGATHPAPSTTHVVPPPAPSPTAKGKSPEAPDPHPPLGGIGPDGKPVGGAQLLSRGFVLPPHAPALPQHLTAASFVVADLDTGDIVAARDPHGRYQAASIQKLLTSITVLPLLPGNRTLTISRSAADTEGSHAGLVAGGTYTVDDIFRGLLLVSGNDAAAALAEAAGGRAHTVALMNTEARTLGGYDTFVQTPSGLDGWQQLTSAYDMTLFLRAAVAQPRIIAYDTVDRATLPAQHVAGAGKAASHAVTLYNQNYEFLHTVKGALLAKTGYTDAAQHTFAGVIERNGHRYGVVLMRAQRYPQDQWQQATKLVDWATKLPAGTAPVGKLPVDHAVAAPGVATTGAAAVASTTPSATTSRSGTPSPSPSTSRGSSGSKAGRLAIVAVVFILLFLLSQRIRRAAHPRRPGDEQYRLIPRRDPRRPPPRRRPNRPDPPDGPDLRKHPPGE